MKKVSKKIKTLYNWTKTRSPPARHPSHSRILSEAPIGIDPKVFAYGFLNALMVHSRMPATANPQQVS